MGKVQALGARFAETAAFIEPEIVQLPQAAIDRIRDDPRFDTYEHVLDNILHPYRITGALRLDKTVRERARRLAEGLGVGDKLERHPSHLSQGEKQRVAICRALANGPRLLLADEPTGNLDSDNSEKIFEILRSLRHNGLTIVMITHNLELATRADRTVHIKDGLVHTES